MLLATAAATAGAAVPASASAATIDHVGAYVRDDGRVVVHVGIRHDHDGDYEGRTDVTVLGAHPGDRPVARVHAHSRGTATSQQTIAYRHVLGPRASARARARLRDHGRLRVRVRYSARAGGHVERLETTLNASLGWPLTIVGPQAGVSGPGGGSWFLATLQNAGSDWCTGETVPGSPMVIIFNCWYSSKIVFQIQSTDGNATTGTIAGDWFYDVSSHTSYDLPRGDLQGTLVVQDGRAVSAQLSGWAGAEAQP
jgi:hypothetical protein